VSNNAVLTSLSPSFTMLQVIYLRRIS